MGNLHTQSQFSFLTFLMAYFGEILNRNSDKESHCVKPLPMKKKEEEEEEEEKELSVQSDYHVNMSFIKVSQHTIFKLGYRSRTSFPLLWKLFLFKMRKMSLYISSFNLSYTHELIWMEFITFRGWSITFSVLLIKDFSSIC